MYREIACICAKKVIDEDHSFEQVEALIVFFSLQRYPEHLGLLCGSKTEAHGALPRAALGASFACFMKPKSPYLSRAPRGAVSDHFDGSAQTQALRISMERKENGFEA